METSEQNPESIVRSREIRLGLIMYGGISLAIYINGVAREFYRAVRGESIYKLIKAFTDSDIVVDIISGTSAGGVNGILLGYALCNKADFATTAELWRNAGDIGALVRDPDKLQDPVLSVLDGEGYYQSELENAFSRMNSERKDEGPDSSKLTEMDVFITSTDVDGRVYNWFDAQGHAVNIKDHRAVFQLKFREKRKNDFEPDSTRDRHRALAKLSRMTSCFPVAFPPVRVMVNPKLTNDADSKYWAQWEKPDKMIAQWGNLPRDASDSERKQCTEGIAGSTRKTKDDYYFLDGGVLDNKPFTYTTREIFYRLADRAVERTLFYVEPDPENFDFMTSATQVNPLQAAQRALISIPGYESIADDLKLITARNEKIYRYNRLINCDGDGADLGSAAERAKDSLDKETLDYIRRFRLLENPESAEKDEESEATTGEPSRYAKARFVTLSERAVRGILKSNEQEPKLNQEAKTAAEKLYRIFDEWDDPNDPASDLTLYNFDVYFRIRRMFHVLYAGPEPGLKEPESFELHRQVLRAIGSQISLLEIIQAAMEKLVDDGEFCWRTNTADKVWEQLLAGYQTLLNTADGDALLPPGYTDCWSKDAPKEDQAVLAAIYQRLFTSKKSGKQNTIGRIAKLLTQLKSNSGIEKPAAFVSALTQTDAYERRMLRYFDAKLAKTGHPYLEQTYDDFLLIDADLFTLETFADLKEKDIIETVRISPRDAQRAFCALDINRKVAGDAVFHFGGFFKKSWRANDILWGRLDGVCQLTETLLKSERVRTVLDSYDHREALKHDIQPGGRLHPAILFPKALPKVQDDLAAWFEKLVDNDPKVRNTETEQAEWEEYVAWEKHMDLLVEAAQMDFLGDEMKNVLNDAVEEQMEWNLYRKTAGTQEDICGNGEKTGSKFKLGNGCFDPTVNALAAEAISDRAMARLERPESLKEFFKGKYSVGSESIAKDVPFWVLLEIIFRGLLVAKTGLLQSLPSKLRDIISGSLPFKAVSSILWLLYGLASTLRTSSRVLLAWRSTVVGLALFSWCVAFFWGRDLVYAGGKFNVMALVLLIIPTVLLFGSFRRLGK